uniref:Uncharacterized protein n=1 Tax=Anopheles atroparvus TaxID=41427 RepID=A0A182IZJ6_ANOAO
MQTEENEEFSYDEQPKSLYLRCLELCRCRCPLRCRHRFVQFEQGFQLPLLCLMNRPMRVDVVSEPRLPLPDITTYPEPVRPCRCRHLPQDRCHRWWAVSYRP